MLANHIDGRFAQVSREKEATREMLHLCMETVRTLARDNERMRAEVMNVYVRVCSSSSVQCLIYKTC